MRLLVGKFGDFMKNIFVSSTFRDMQAERDLLQREVAPAIRKLSREYGEEVNLVDLRWGVDTTELESEEGSLKVMSVCLDEVEKSHPYMLIFLGERYGSIIDPKYTKRVIERKGVDLGLDDYAISITAMEVEFGALSEKIGDVSNCIVCIRDEVSSQISDEETRKVYAIENDFLAKKRDDFRKKISERVNGRVINYTCSWDEKTHRFIDFVTDEGEPLSEKLISSYKKMFFDEWETYSKLSWQEKEFRSTQVYIEQKLRPFRGRKELLKECYETVISGDGVTVIKGDVGSGKSSIMCKLFSMLEANGKTVFKFIASNSVMSESGLQFLRQLVYFLETFTLQEHFEADSMTYEDWLDRLYELADLLNEKVYVGIDALDQMSDDEHLRKLDFIRLHDNLVYFASGSIDFEFPSYSQIYGTLFEVPLLDKNDVAEIATGNFEASSRNAYASLLREIEAKKNSQNPLYVSMLIQRLNMMGLEELFNARTEAEIVEMGIQTLRKLSDDLQGVIIDVITDAIRDIGNESLWKVVELISLTQNGLREQDVISIIEDMGDGITPLDLYRFMNYIDSFFMLHANGCIDFTHKIIRKSIRGKLNAENEERRYSTFLKEYLKTLSREDEVRNGEGFHFACECRDYEFIEALLLDECDYVSLSLEDSIKKELLVDKGEFLSSCMDLLVKAKHFFLSRVREIFDETQDEMTTKMNLLKATMECWERKCENSEDIDDYSELGICYCNYGDALDKVGRYKEALAYYEKDMLTAEKNYSLKEDSESILSLAISHDRNASALLEMGEYQKALELIKKAMDEYEQIYAQTESQSLFERLCTAYVNAGRLLAETGEVDEALELYQKGCDGYRQVFENELDIESLVQLLVGENIFSGFLCELGKYKEAYEICRDATDAAEIIYEKVQDIASLKQLCINYGNLGEILFNLGENDSAIETLKASEEMASKVYEKTQSNENFRYLSSLKLDIGVLFLDLKQYEEAFEYLNEAVDIREILYATDTNPADLSDLASSYRQMGVVLGRLGDFENAVDYLTKAIDIYNGIYEQSQNIQSLNDLGLSYSYLSNLLLEFQKPEEALVFSRKAMEMFVLIDEKENSLRSLENLSNGYLNLGMLLCDLNEKDEGILCLKEGLEGFIGCYSQTESLKMQEKISYGWKKLGDGHWKFGEYDEALVAYDADIQVRNEINEKCKSPESLRELGLSCMKYGYSLYEIGNSTDAIDYLTLTAEMFEKLYEQVYYINDLINLKNLYRNIGNIYINIKEFETALSYHKKADDALKEIKRRQSSEQ